MVGGITSRAKAEDRRPLIFVSYSHKDTAFQERMNVHLAPLARQGVEIWFDGDMVAGDDVTLEIRRKLRAADIFVALASPDYLHSTYCYEKEYLFALRKARRQRIHVVVAIMRRCAWKHTQMANYLTLPRDGKAVEDYGRRSRAYEEIVEGLRKILKQIKATKPSATAKRPARKVAPRKVAVRHSPGPPAAKKAVPRKATKTAAAAKSGSASANVARNAVAKRRAPVTRKK